ncbi:DBF4-type zinc finger-containing protein 2 [Rhinophrynus dorsalis]
MFDKKKPSDEGSLALAQGLDKRDNEEEYGKMECTSSGNAQNPELSGSSVPPGHYRQGYCSCCQVHYINLEMHLASRQHRQISTCNRNRFSSNILMERFLQDVHLYHPQNYHDVRPTYDDIPDVNLLPTSLEDGLPPQLQDKELIDTNREKSVVGSQYVSEPYHTRPPNSKCNFRQIPFTLAHKEKQGKVQCSTDVQSQLNIVSSISTLTTGQEDLHTVVNTTPHCLPFCTLPICPSSQQTTKNKCPDSPYSVLSPKSNKNNLLKKQYEMWKMCPGTKVSTIPKSGLQNMALASQGSYCNLTSGISYGKQTCIESQGDIDDILRNHMLDSQVIKVCEAGKTSVDEIIEEVISKYCHGISHTKSPKNDKESVSSLNIQSLIGYTEGSSLSFAWDVPVQSEDGQSKALIKNIDLLKEINVSLDEDYKSKLTSALSACPVKEVEDIKVESEEAILPALPHVPPSFVGKTWSQIMYEDDLKIEALVRQFKKGRFHCYFESESLTNCNKKNKRRLKSEEMEKKIEDQKYDWKEVEAANALPTAISAVSLSHDSDISPVKSETVLKPKLHKPGRRTWRLASRCQIVKVSHGTQTSVANYPVIKRKVIQNECQESDQGTKGEFEEERTPDMKTRMCALKLPESYNKILTPIQPKTMVYVLSHPDIKLCRGMPACISNQGRNKFSTDSRDSVNYAYKQSPLKYYDPLTNRILKTPPRNVAREAGTKGPCVRKLFRSLSSDVNVDKLDLKQKESTVSKKSFSSSSAASLYFDSSKGKTVNPSTKRSRSMSTEFTDSLKSGQSNRPYTNTLISPCNANLTLDKKDVQFIPSSTKTRKSPLGSKKNQLLKRGNVKTSKRKTKSISELKSTINSKYNHDVVAGPKRELAQERANRTRKQTTRKSSLFLKTVSLVKTHRPRQKTVKKGERDEVLIKHQFVSLKHTKRKVNSTEAVLKHTSQANTKSRNSENPRNTNIYSICTRSSKHFAPETFSRNLRKQKIRTPTTRSHSNSVTRKRVR